MNDDRSTLEDGGTLAFKEIGDPDGTPVIHFHGAPSCRTALDFLHEDFAERGLRIVSPDRPGYGGTSPQPDRSLADWPDVVDELADAIGVDRFAVVGFSSGGPYAVAACSQLPERVIGGVVVAGPTDPSSLESFDGLPDVEQELMAQPDEGAATEWCVHRFGPDGGRFPEDDSFDWAAPDVAFVEDDEMSTHFERVTEESFRQGVIGYAQDMLVQGRPWPFDTARIDVPVHVIHGELDEVVSIEHSRHTAATIPEASLVQLPDHGHLSVVEEFPRLVTELLAAD